MGNIRLIDTADVYNSCSYHFTAKVACEAAAQLPAGHHATGDVITAFWSYKQQLTRWLTRPNKSEWMVSYKRWIRHTSEFLPKTVIGLAINKDYKGGKRRKVDTVDPHSVYVWMIIPDWIWGFGRGRLEFLQHRIHRGQTSCMTELVTKTDIYIHKNTESAPFFYLAFSQIHRKLQIAKPMSDACPWARLFTLLSLQSC